MREATHLLARASLLEVAYLAQAQPSIYIYNGTAGVLESKWDQFLSLNSLHCSYSFVVLVRLATAISWHSVAAAVGYSGDLYLSDAGVPRYHPCIRVWELSTVWNSRLEYHFLIEFI